MSNFRINFIGLKDYEEVCDYLYDEKITKHRWYAHGLASWLFEESESPKLSLTDNGIIQIYLPEVEIHSTETVSGNPRLFDFTDWAIFSLEKTEE